MLQSSLMRAMSNWGRAELADTTPTAHFEWSWFCCVEQASQAFHRVEQIGRAQGAIMPVDWVVRVLLDDSNRPIHLGSGPCAESLPGAVVLPCTRTSF